jgi:hypothetical protein
MASSEHEDGAVVCCELVAAAADHDPSSTRLHFHDASPPISAAATVGGFLDVCPNKSLEYAALPLASRLSRFPEAWLLPLFPLLLQAAAAAAASLCGCVRRGSASRRRGPARELFVRRAAPLLGRLGFYVVLFNFRGWVLYVALNRLEDTVVASDGPFHRDCWYAPHLRADQRHECVGRAFDFSDHMVLYFAQLLPVPLAEGLYALLTSGYWSSREENAAIVSVRSSWGSFVPQLFLVLGLAYLYVVVYLGAVKTALFFHTIDEVVLGYAVSLLVQVPLAWLQCAPRGTSAGDGKKPKEKEGGDDDNADPWGGGEVPQASVSDASVSCLSSLSSVARSIRSSSCTDQAPPSGVFGWARHILFPDL